LQEEEEAMLQSGIACIAEGAMQQLQGNKKAADPGRDPPEVGSQEWGSHRRLPCLSVLT